MTTFLEAYAEFGPDTIAISQAMNIKEHEADSMVNARMELDRKAKKEHLHKVRQATKPKTAKRGLIRFAGFDENELSRW